MQRCLAEKRHYQLLERRSVNGAAPAGQLSVEYQ
jgi:hypothetical protein